MRASTRITITVAIIFLMVVSFAVGISVAESYSEPEITVVNNTDPNVLALKEYYRTGVFPDYSNVTFPEGDQMLLRPPQNGTSETTLDLEIAKRVTSDNVYKHSRWALAALDAKMDACQYNCVIGVDVTREETPHIYNLLTVAAPKAASPIGYIKPIYMRQRPFMVGGANKFSEHSNQTCTPDYEPTLRGDGSYPSGHSGIQYSQALILALVDPVDATEILKRGRQTTESRVVCNAHWYSDTQAGMQIASIDVGIMGAVPEFQAELALAQEEFNTKKQEYIANGRKPTKDWKVSGTDDIANFINEKLLNWDCTHEKEVLDGFDFLPKL